MTEIVKATFGSPDRPLRIAGMQIDCYVLEDERRVIIQKGVLSSLNIAQGSWSGSPSGNRLQSFVRGQAISQFIDEELLKRVESPIEFRVPAGGLAHGYEATILADLCDAILTAREQGKLHHTQSHIAKQAEMLVRAFARVGIIALVDEATGFQAARRRWSLQRILEQYISPDLRAWTKTFPDEFYEEIFRLRRWTLIDVRNRPACIGNFTNDIVYARLAPGVLDELKRLTPLSHKGHRIHKYHQRLSGGVGHPQLQQHLDRVIFLMKGSVDWDQFYASLQRAFPRPGDNWVLPYAS